MSLAERIYPALQRFPDGAVLVAYDADGYPVSLRCRPRLEGETLVIDQPKWFDGVDGPAALLGHRHDEQGWNLRFAQAKGVIETQDGTVVFLPMGLNENTGSPGAMIRFVRGGHRAATEYLRRRDLPRPPIPWDTIKAARTAVSKRR
ncbi:hypothetical protein [Nocardia yamanashiensis]|uniref:hypothetical protein n=1 Tax=Nocardia yamanashiensis TaxID=209247 RepID=UPI00082F14D7|nr:hypothetical protein [Nocardia yamanashiensis]